MNVVTLAFLGDAVYELSVRSKLVGRCGNYPADKLHFEAVKYVKAASQAKALKGIKKEGILSEEELDVVRRARNRKPKSIPKNSDPLEYKLATAFEALLGYHFEAGRSDRAEELIELAMNIIEGNDA